MQPNLYLQDIFTSHVVNETEEKACSGTVFRSSFIITVAAS